MLQYTDPERLDHLEGSKEDALISLGMRNKRFFMSGLKASEGVGIGT